ncbi:MAG TPA: zinc ribbon domain-containing protein [Candidatus Binatia bacterium]|nr:zinc ribbon domain-containing protein [Candidatus Binatia bacterium]
MRAEERASPTSDASCPWCSAAVPSGAERCPACGATLQAAEEPQLPGVTAVDPQAVLWSVRSMERRRRSKLLTWLSGEAEPEATTPAAPGALDPPPPEVRREMLRLAMAAAISDLSAEVGALEADELVEGGAERADPGSGAGAETPTDEPTPE